MPHLDIPDCPDRFPTVFELLFFIEDCVRALPGNIELGAKVVDKTERTRLCRERLDRVRVQKLFSGMVDAVWRIISGVFPKTRLDSSSVEQCARCLVYVVAELHVYKATALHVCSFGLERHALLHHWLRSRARPFAAILRDLTDVPYRPEDAWYLPSEDDAYRPVQSLVGAWARRYEVDRGRAECWQGEACRFWGRSQSVGGVDSEAKASVELVSQDEGMRRAWELRFAMLLEEAYRRVEGHPEGDRIWRSVARCIGEHLAESECYHALQHYDWRLVWANVWEEVAGEIGSSPDEYYRSLLPPGLPDVSDDEAIANLVANASAPLLERLEDAFLRLRYRGGTAIALVAGLGTAVAVRLSERKQFERIHGWALWMGAEGIAPIDFSPGDAAEPQGHEEDGEDVARKDLRTAVREVSRTIDGIIGDEWERRCATRDLVRYTPYCEREDRPVTRYSFQGMALCFDGSAPLPIRADTINSLHESVGHRTFLMVATARHDRRMIDVLLGHRDIDPNFVAGTPKGDDRTALLIACEHYVRAKCWGGVWAKPPVGEELSRSEVIRSWRDLCIRLAKLADSDAYSRYGRPIDARARVLGTTALGSALDAGDDELVRILLERGADPYREYRSMRGATWWQALFPESILWTRPYDVLAERGLLGD